MTPPIPRLKRRAEFLDAARLGRKWVTPGLIVQMRRRSVADSGVDPSDAGVRVGFTASRKVGNAVARNRAKRRLRAVADLLLPDYGEAGCDYVMIGRTVTVTRPFKALIDDMTTALHRVKTARQPPPRGAAHARRRRRDRKSFANAATPDVGR